MFLACRTASGKPRHGGGAGRGLLVGLRARNRPGTVAGTAATAAVRVHAEVLRRCPRQLLHVWHRLLAKCWRVSQLEWRLLLKQRLLLCKGLLLCQELLLLKSVAVLVCDLLWVELLGR